MHLRALCSGISRLWISKKLMPMSTSSREAVPGKLKEGRFSHAEDLMDFSLHLNDIGVISMVYDAFLSEFLLCYGYWKKYAVHQARLCSHKEMIEVFERAVLAATYYVDLWVSYCNFAMLLYEDPADIRRLFERGLHFVGKNYLCHLLWDKYIEFEYSQKQWSYLANIYINTLRFPTKKLHSYYESLDAPPEASEAWMGRFSHAEGTRTIGVISKIDQAAGDQKCLAAVLALLLNQGSRSAADIQWVALIGQSISIASAQAGSVGSEKSLETAWRLFQLFIHDFL